MPKYVHSNSSQPRKAKEAPSPDEERLTLLDTNPGFLSPRDK